LSDVNFDAIANNSISGNKIYGGTISTSAAVFEGSSANAIVRITQTGSGNALVVEDETNPDSTPFVVNASGNVGIGTSSITQKLQVEGSVNIAEAGGSGRAYGFGLHTQTFEGESIPYYGVVYSTAGGGFNTILTGYDSLKFLTLGSERMRIDSSGNVGIGTSSPSYNIDVKGSTGISAQRATDTDRLIMQWDGLTSYGNSVGAYNNIKFISQNNSGSVERMRIDSSGRVTIPYQPSFRVGSGSAIENTTSSAITMIFTTVAHNTGGHFNTTNGTFTAPVAGSYQFNFSGNVKETTSTPSNFWVELRINGSRKAIWYTNNDSDLTWQLISGSLVIYLQANDAVDLRQSQYTWFDSSMWTQFSGHLLG